MEEISKVKKLLLKNQKSRILAENIVIEDKWCFYKSPNFSGQFLFYKWVCPYEFVNKSYNLLKKYFWNDFQIVDSDIYKDNDLYYIIKQKKINWRMLHKKDFKDSDIKKSFEKLLEINEKIWKKEGMFLDILWTDVIFKPLYIHNLFICKDKKLYIFDFWLLNKNAKSFIFRILSYLFYYLQKFWIKNLLLR